MNLLRTAWALVLAAGMASGARAAEPASTDPWAPMERFIGQWTGQATGQAGEGSATRSYRFVMNRRYIQEAHVSRYPVQEKNKRGEVHEHLGMFSYDKARKQLVLRQFHGESFVNTYRLSPDSQATRLVFESESFENFSNSWRARETYEFHGDDEFTETFELAPPEQPFQVYSQTRFKRRSSPGAP